LPGPSLADNNPQLRASVFSRDEIRASLIAELRSVLGRQTPARTRGRRDSAGVLRVLKTLKEEGVDLPAMRGPWRVAEVEGPRRRSGVNNVPCVERGHTQVLAATAERAQELAGLLNWCEIEEEELQPPVA